MAWLHNRQCFGSAHLHKLVRQTPADKRRTRTGQGLTRVLISHAYFRKRDLCTDISATCRTV